MVLAPAGAAASGRWAADEEARAGVRVDEVDGRALAVRGAQRVDGDRDPQGLAHGVLRVRAIVESEAVLGRAAALASKNADCANCGLTGSPPHHES